MKHILFSVLSLVLILSILSGCAGSFKAPDIETTDRLSKIQAQAILTVAVSPDYPPYEFLSSGKLQGVDIEIANYIARKLGAKLNIIQADFNSVLSSAANGSCDLGISAITYKEERESSLLYSIPYLYPDTEYGYQIPLPEEALYIVSAKDGNSDKLIAFVNDCIASMIQEEKITEWYAQYSQNKK